MPYQIRAPIGCPDLTANTVDHPQVKSTLTQAQAAIERQDFVAAYRLAMSVVSNHPAQFDALFIAAGAAMQLNKVQSAIELFDSALSCNPQRKDIHAYLGRCYLALHQSVEAIYHANEALEMASLGTQSLMTVGVILMRCADYSGALDAYQRLTKLAPQSAEVKYNLGSVLKFLGRFDEAEQAYEEAIQMNPNVLGAHAALAELPSSFPEHRIQRLRAHIAQRPSSELFYALARDLERSEAYAAAFEAFSQSAELRVQDKSYSFASDQSLFAAAHENLANFAVSSAPSYGLRPLFVMGMPRTGTTLAERILTCHPEVASGGELNFVPLLAKRMSGDDGAHAIAPEVIRQAANIEKAKFAQAYAEMVRESQLVSDYVVDKYPINYFFMPLLRQAFPQSVLIVLRRNPMDTVVSNFRQLFAAGSIHQLYSNSLMDCARYVIEYCKLVDAMRKVDGLNMIEVSYEALVSDPEVEIRALLEHCGLTWDPTCLSVQDNVLPIATASSYQARQPILPKAVGRWKFYEEALEQVKQLFVTHHINWE